MQETSNSLPNQLRFRILRIQFFRIFWLLLNNCTFPAPFPCSGRAGLAGHGHMAKEAWEKPISPVWGILSANIIC